MEDKEFEKAYKRYISLISKYPEIIRIIKQLRTFKSLFSIIPNNYLEEYSHQETNEEEIKKVFVELTSFLEEIEENITTLERKQQYNIPVFNFNADLVISHSRKITQIDYQISYLRMILTYYETHLARRYDELQKCQANYDPIFLDKIFSAFQYINDNLMKEKGLTDFPFMMDLEFFEDKIMTELYNLIEMKSLDEKSPAAILEAINNPPGTKRRSFAVEEGEDKNQQNESKSEYMIKIEVMETLKISPTTVYNYTKRGLLKQYKIERKNYYKREEVMKLLEGNKR